MVSSGVYQIRNQMNGKRYIGGSECLQRRKKEHLGDLRRRQHYNSHLQRAFDKYGESAFVFSILEYVEDVSQLILREQHYLDALNPEYNMALVAGSPMTGRHHTQGTRVRMSAAQSGKHNPNYGMRLSDEHIRKISKAGAGRHHSKKTRMKISEALTGRHHGERTKQKISESLMGHRHTARSIRKMSEATSGNQHHNFGKHLSEETRRKISKGVAAYWRRVRAANSVLIALRSSALEK